MLSDSMSSKPACRTSVVLVAANSCAVKQRIGPMLRAIRSAAVVVADGAALWQLIQSDFHANQREIVESIARHGGLAPHLDVETATDILWTLNHPDVWLLLTGERGWSPSRFQIWFSEALTQQLLGMTENPGPEGETSVGDPVD